MSLLDDAKIIEAARPASCGLCDFIEGQPPGRQSEFDELVNTTRRNDPTKYAVGPSATLAILRREGYTARTRTSIDTHRSQGHRR